MLTTSRVIRPLALLAAIGLLAACGPSSDGAVAASSSGGDGDESAVTAAEIPSATAVETPAESAPAEKPEQPSLVVDTIDHGAFDLAEQRGRWTVVNFWATWCAPCLKEIPDFNALDARREDIGIIGLAYEEITPEAMRAFYDEKVRPDYPVAIVDVYSPPADFDTPRGLPFTILVSPEGRVAHQFLGPVTGEQIEAKISELTSAKTSA